MGTVKYNMTYFKMIQVSLLVHCSGCFNGLYALLLTRPVHHRIQVFCVCNPISKEAQKASECANILTGSVRRSGLRNNRTLFHSMTQFCRSPCSSSLRCERQILPRGFHFSVAKKTHVGLTRC